MAPSDEKIRELTRKLFSSRMRLMCNNGFFGLLLMHIIFALDGECETCYTDGERMYFNTEFLERLTEKELDYVLMHNILHVALKHCFRGKGLDRECFDRACDIVVNSNILQSCNMNTDSIYISGYGIGEHLSPDGKESYEFSAEELYQLLLVQKVQCGKGKKNNKNNKGKGLAINGKADAIGDNVADKKGGSGNENRENRQSGFDEHSKWEDKWEENEDRNILESSWQQRLINAAEVMEIRDPCNERGTVPLFAVRMLRELKKPQTDWRTILDTFVQEDITDYSFSPPDRRFDDSPFFLPDFNEKEDAVKDILFMIDTSGSMSDDMITAAYSEIKGAIDQFDGKLQGWLGFFDTAVVPPEPFADENEFSIIKARGGGGTDFNIIFDYVFGNMSDNLPASIIILTDGYAPFPDKEKAMGIPVLWLLNNQKVTPPWGKITRIEV